MIIAAGSATVVSRDGETETLSLAHAGERLGESTHLLCDAQAVARQLRLNAQTVQGRHGDVLDLFAFVLPARPCLPIPAGLARALRLPRPKAPEDEALTLLSACDQLLGILSALGPQASARAQSIAAAMSRSGWPWAATILKLFPRGDTPASLAAFVHLPEWEDGPPRGAPGQIPVEPEAATERLRAMLGPEGAEREGQLRYAALAASAFAAPQRADEPTIVLAEAGTGTGKTAGYLAAASLWAERNDGAVWISTFTKNLQRQIDQELTRLYPDPAEKAEKVVVRKGRENYLCLLNFQEALMSGGRGQRDQHVLGLIARWLGATRDGDIAGGDLPPWLAAEAAPLRLTDRRGECVYSACAHYRRCFIEANQRKAKNASFVIANHALVMTLAARGTPEEQAQREARGRYVFDEAHHLFGAADSIFSSHLTALDGAELRRWIRGREVQEGGRGRGLRERLLDLLAEPEDENLLETALVAAGALPGPGWGQRLSQGSPRGAMEQFLFLVREQVLARSENDDRDYGLECAPLPLNQGLAEAAQALAGRLHTLERALLSLTASLRKRLDRDAESLDTASRARIESLARGMEWRAQLVLGSWRSMLEQLGGTTPAGFVDWFAIERDGGREHNCGMHRHFIDPTEPFAAAVLKRAHGALLTSATLRDRPPEEEALPSWQNAEARTGLTHLALPAIHGAFPSPFDYAAKARVFIVRDTDRRDPAAFAAAYRELFLAAGGGALGLFTAIRTLRLVHQRIAAPLNAEGIKLYAQHVDPYDMGLLVDMFRAETDSCLLGTDAARDGVDVPGRSLRLIVYDRVPWPRPDILHKARRAAFGGRIYDEMTTRFRIAQAFGRLIRQEADKGVFVFLDAQTPTRLLSALPPGCPVQRCGLAEAIGETRRFLLPG
ncbi:MAG: ATP-dependent DNA helicase [Alphaproteobacteria bacterium]|nr:ATP-dependent DNA helicase [Alphaproteobacteria bacterium]